MAPPQASMASGPPHPPGWQPPLSEQQQQQPALSSQHPSQLPGGKRTRAQTERGSHSGDAALAPPPQGPAGRGTTQKPRPRHTARKPASAALPPSAAPAPRLAAPERVPTLRAPLLAHATGAGSTQQQQPSSTAIRATPANQRVWALFLTHEQWVVLCNSMGGLAAVADRLRTHSLANVPPGEAREGFMQLLLNWHIHQEPLTPLPHTLTPRARERQRVQKKKEQQQLEAQQQQQAQQFLECFKQALEEQSMQMQQEHEQRMQRMQLEHEQRMQDMGRQPGTAPKPASVHEDSHVEQR